MFIFSLSWERFFKSALVEGVDSEGDKEISNNTVF